MPNANTHARFCSVPACYRSQMPGYLTGWVPRGPLFRSAVAVYRRLRRNGWEEWDARLTVTQLLMTGSHSPIQSGPNVYVRNSYEVLTAVA